MNIINCFFYNNSELKRNKRGLINVIGNVADVLFGVLDDQYAAKMEKNIEKMRQDQKFMLHLAKEETSVLDATSHLIKKTHQSFINNFKKIEIELNEVIERVNTLHTEVQQEKTTTI
jgi:hypothetical protein